MPSLSPVLGQVEAPLASPDAPRESIPRLAPLPDGGFVATWLSGTTPNTLPVGTLQYGRFDASGAQLGPATDLASQVQNHLLVALDDGRVAIAREEPGYTDILVQILDPISGDTTDARVLGGNLNFARLETVVALPGGRVAVLWNTFPLSGSGQGALTIVEADGTPNPTVILPGGASASAALIGGDTLVIAFYQHLQFVRLDGSQARSDLALPTDAVISAVVALADGGFAVTCFVLPPQTGQDIVRLLRFDSAGMQVGAATEIAFPQDPRTGQNFPTVVQLGNGDLVVATFSGFQEPLGLVVDPDGMPDGPIRALGFGSPLLDSVRFAPSGQDEVLVVSGREGRIAFSRFDTDAPPAPVIGLGGPGANSLIGSDLADTLIGGRAADSLVGEAGADTLDGGGGNDILVGGAGVDTLRGRAGGDTLQGDDGNDYLAGGDGADMLLGGAGNDTLRDGFGVVLADGGDGADRISAGSSADLLRGGAGNDTLQGLGSADTLDGGDDDDRLEGGEDNDLLFGGAGADRLFGDAGADTLVGGAGADTLRGGDGADLFRFTLVSDSSAATPDLIAGFQRRLDRIDLSAFDVTFAAISQSAIPGGRLVTVELGAEDLSFAMNNPRLLTAADFIFG